VIRGEVRPAHGIGWVVERNGVTVFDRDRGALVSIAYPYAGLWAMIAGGAYTAGRACELMMLLTGMDEGTAERQAAASLFSWRELGLIQAA
jgi:hypothetical protein